jgi:hypothetical protein
VTHQRPGTRDRLSALVVVATPVVLGVGLVLHPRETSNETQQLDIVARHASALGAAHLLIYLGAALAVAATAALVRLGDRHHAKGSLAAGAVAVFGAIALAATAAIDLVTRHIVEAGVAQTTTITVFHKYETPTDLGVAVFVAAFALSLGLAALALTLWRSRALPGWAALSLAVGALAAPLPVIAVRDTGAVLLLVSMAAAARAVQQTCATTSVVSNEARAIPTTGQLPPGRS